MDLESIQRILAIDCGSTTTKAILLEKRDGVFRLISRGEAPTSVEAPVEDVTIGVLNAIAEIQELTGLCLLSEERRLIKPSQGRNGVDLLAATSSAGGGLQMMVAGVVKTMTGESATRAALGAGAIVMDVLAINDGRLAHQKIADLRQLRPDMILLSGGIDGGASSHVAALAEMIASANPQTRHGKNEALPVVFAGNSDVRSLVQECLQQKVTLDFAENIRPTLEQENLLPTRQKIQHLFLEHVMRHAPGYLRLMEMTDSPIIPTPAAVGEMMQMVARKKNLNVLGVDIGGATTDVFSVFVGVYHKTVSANIGMSYSLGNVCVEAGLEKISQWLPFDLGDGELMNRVKNKMIRPTTIPGVMEELIFEQACAREALRLSFLQHRALAVGLKGVQQERSIGDVFAQIETGQEIIRMPQVDLLIGSGGVLSHAPRRSQAAMMMIDAFQPEGITELAVDSIFMMPQLGVLAKIHESAALSVFERDCLIPLGTCIAPVGVVSPGQIAVTIEIERPEGWEKRELKSGEMLVVPCPSGASRAVRLHPAAHLDLGAGPGGVRQGELRGGVVGLIFDGRGRPFSLPTEALPRKASLALWNKALALYPEGY